MPIVNGKHFPYTKAGKAQAKRAALPLAKRKKQMTSDGFMRVRSKK